MPRSTRLLVITVVAVLAVVTPVAISAAIRGVRKVAIDTQLHAWRDDPTTTSSTEWRKLHLGIADNAHQVPGELTIVSRSAVSVTVSADFRGAPVQLRIVDKSGVLRPGPASFDPEGRDTSRSFTFVGPGTNSTSCRALHVQWRSPTGREATVTRADLVATYRTAMNPDPQCE